MTIPPVKNFNSGKAVRKKYPLSAEELEKEVRHVLLKRKKKKAQRVGSKECVKISSKASIRHDVRIKKRYKKKSIKKKIQREEKDRHHTSRKTLRRLL